MTLIGRFVLLSLYYTVTALPRTENLRADGNISLDLRTAVLDGVTGERPEGRGCIATACAAPAVPTPLVCGSGPVTATLTLLNPTAMWRLLLPFEANGAARMATLTTCESVGGLPTELGAYRSIPFAQVCESWG